MSLLPRLGRGVSQDWGFLSLPWEHTFLFLQSRRAFSATPGARSLLLAAQWHKNFAPWVAERKVWEGTHSLPAAPAEPSPRPAPQGTSGLCLEHVAQFA